MHQRIFTNFVAILLCGGFLSSPLGAAELPIRDNSAWKITFPTQSEKGNALEVKNPDFAQYVASGASFPDDLANYCYLSEEGRVFTTEYTGVTTSSKTKYSRTELREMIGSEEHNWTLDQGGRLHCKLKVSDLQGGANKIIFMQIHGKKPESKPLLKCLWEKGNIRLLTKNGKKLSDFKRQQNYAQVALGEWFTCTIDCSRQALTIAINGETVETYSAEEVLDFWPEGNTYYFKAGNYLQHNVPGTASTVVFETIEVSHP